MGRQPSFERALAKLEEIVARLEGEDVPLDDALKLFEEGIRLSRFCQQRLEEAEARVELIVKNADGSFSSAPLFGDEESADEPPVPLPPVPAVPPAPAEKAKRPAKDDDDDIPF